MPEFDIRYSCSMELQPFVENGTLTEVNIDDQACQDVLIAYGSRVTTTPTHVELGVGRDLAGSTGYSPETATIDVKIGVVAFKPRMRWLRPSFIGQGKKYNKSSLAEEIVLHEFSHVADMSDRNTYFEERVAYEDRARKAAVKTFLPNFGKAIHVMSTLSGGMEKRSKPVQALSIAICGIGVAIYQLKKIARDDDMYSPTEERAYDREEAYKGKFPGLIEVE